MSQYDDLIRAGLLDPGDRRQAALEGLFALGAQIGRRGEARLSPTPPPMNLAGVMEGYRNSMQASLQRGALAKKLADDEGMRNILALNPVNDQEAQRLAQRIYEPARQEALSDYADSPLSGFDNDSSLKADGIPAIAEDAVTELLPLARQQTTVPTALRGMPQNAQSLISQVAQYNPKAALTMAGSVLAAQNKFRKPEYHNVTVNGTPGRLTTKQLEVHRAAGAKIEPFSAPLVQQTTNAADPMAKYGVKTWENASTQGAIATQKLQTLNEMGALLSTGVQTGLVSSWSLPLRSILSEFGIQDDGKVGVQQAIQAIGSKLALDNHGPGMGPMTDADFRIYARMVVNLKNSAAGNALIYQRMRREYMGQQLYPQVLREQMKKGGPGSVDPVDAWKEVARRLEATEGPLLPRFKKGQRIPDSLIGRVVVVEDENGSQNAFLVKP